MVLPILEIASIVAVLVAATPAQEVNVRGTRLQVRKALDDEGH